MTLTHIRCHVSWGWFADEQGLGGFFTGDDFGQEIADDDGDDDADNEEDDEDDVSNFLNDVGDPLAAIEGLDTSDNALGNLVIKNKRERKGRRTSSRLQRAAEDPVDTSKDATDEGDSDGEGGLKQDVWSDALAEQFGLTPAISRKSQKRRQQAKIKRLKQGKVMKDRSGMPTIAAEKLGEGNLLYATQQYQEAAQLFMDAIRLAPQFPDAYTSLGLLYETIGDARKSLNFYLFAAHLTRKDKESWKRVAALSREQGLLRQAIYCINQVIRREKDDAEWRYERGNLFVELGEDKRAQQDLDYFWKLHPSNPEVIKQLTRLHYRLGQLEEAKTLIQNFVQQYPESKDLTHVNLLAELFVNPAFGHWQEVISLLDSTRRELKDPEDLPIELETKGAIALAHLGEIDRAIDQVKGLLEQPIEGFFDVYLWVASEFESLGYFHAAEPFLEAIALEPDLSNIQSWKRYALAREVVVGDNTGSLEAWESITSKLNPSHPDYVDAYIEYANVLCQGGKYDVAKEKISNIERANLHSTGTLFIQESTYLHRAKVLRQCQKDSLFVDMFFPLVEKTLRLMTKNTDVPATLRQKAKESRGGVSSDGHDFFVWHNSQERRRSKGTRVSENDTVEVNESSGDEEEDYGDDDALPVLEHLMKGEAAFDDVIVYLVKVLLAMDKVEDAKYVAQMTVDILGKKYAYHHFLLLCH